MTHVASPLNITNKIHDEFILVVKRTDIMPHENFQGLKVIDCDQYLNIIKTHQEFFPRSLMEIDPTYKQIIPYLIFKYKNQYLLMQRHSNASEQRLKNKLTLGIGGHIRHQDIQSNDIFGWAKREFNEEINYTGNFIIQPLGILNDDSNDVGKVHIGFVFLLHGDSPDISIKSELKWGSLVSLDTCKNQINDMESWSQIVIPFLP